VRGDLTGRVAVANPVSVNIPGVYAVTYNVNDGNGNNAAQIVRMVTVADTTGPVFTSPPVASETLDANASCKALVPDFMAGVAAVDACTGPAALTQSPAAGTTVTRGVTGVTVTATDAHALATAQIVTLTVLDITPPAFTTPPVDKTVDADASCAALVPDFTAALRRWTAAPAW